MPIIEISAVVVGDRQRAQIDSAPLGELKQSILENGLLNCPVFSEIDGEFHLVAGERRFRAIEQLAAEKKPIRYNGEEVPLGSVPFSTLGDVDVMRRFIAELDENIMRVDLSWQDKNRALAALHRMRVEQNPTHRQLDTAREVLSKMPSGEGLPPVPKPESFRRVVTVATVIANNLHRPEIAKARNETEAYNLILKHQEEHFTAELIRRRKTANPIDTIRCEVRVGDCIPLMQALDPNQFDLILTDPPYGVNASGPGYRARAVHHHNYDDTPAYARELMRGILIEGFRVTKNQANLMFFTDIKHFDWLVTFSSQMGWKPWRFPIIWQKSQSEGLTPWQGRGPVHTFDVIFYATKGFRGLHTRILDILTCPRVKRNERLYAAEKPIPLLKQLIEAGCLAGDSILDPCCGSGSTLVAAKQLHRASLGIELDPAVADLAIVRTTRGDDAVTNWSVLDEVDNALDAEFFGEAAQ